MAAIERLRDRTASALTTNARSVRAKARIHLGDVAHRQLMKVDELINKTKAAGRDPEREPLSRMLEVAWPPPWLKEIPEGAERDEYEATCEGLCDFGAPIKLANQRLRAVGFTAIAFRLSSFRRAPLAEPYTRPTAVLLDKFTPALLKRGEPPESAAVKSFGLGILRPIVVKERLTCETSALHRTNARAALIWALVKFFNIILTYSFHMV